MNSETNSQVQVARIDVWSRIFFAGALLLLLVNQVQLQMQVSRAQAASAPVAYVPAASSTPDLYREASRYPQVAPARNQAQVLQAPQEQTQAQVQPMVRPQGGWVF
ncbi:hypothetical protein M2D07_017290 [Pseudomonas sp. BGr12]|uniref:hypothetical protein n=1 Tax=unclassified Pseudomonas TaxID=196821 RepID=UPI001783F389|nr:MULTISPECIES: hypothetical protein [unclassified Pseudomonas]MBD9502563.1 hypothetical protein [Pseudomonas sp. PDM17]MBD9577425.1 hypothetical protein [Pseudomonas sp. PDM23]MBD9671002.1 hypothetical protein [Pseudomonas sp. PDM21]MDL2428774.1 hypothetical protein [Pseudomonas sp. BJa5]